MSYSELIIVEVCPHCEREIQMLWDAKKDGYKAFCPHCGETMMLCSECRFNPKTGEYDGSCDWYNGHCKRNKKKITLITARKKGVKKGLRQP